jgi:5-methylcytosine-specific restriction endonuclease McrA
MTKKQKQLLDELYKRDKDKHVCHYCGVQEEEFLDLWGKFYGLPYRGRRLEIDHKHAVVKDNRVIRKTRKGHLKHTPEHCVLACALCNMAKSNMFTHEEFKKVGKVIREIWQERRNSGLTVQEGQD